MREEALVELKIDDRVFAIGYVEVSDATPGSRDYLEENEMHAMFAFEKALPAVRQLLWERGEMSPQQAYLQTLTALVTAQYGRRNEVAENETSIRVLAHYGMRVVSGIGI
jgi:hypothetical protein